MTFFLLPLALLLLGASFVLTGIRSHLRIRRSAPPGELSPAALLSHACQFACAGISSILVALALGVMAPLILAILSLLLVLAMACLCVRITRDSTIRRWSVAVLLSWTGTGLCAGATSLFSWHCARWHAQSEFRSPDGGNIARVEILRSPFFDRYEISYRLKIVRAVDGNVIREETAWDADVADGFWDRPDVTFTWNPDSRGGVLNTEARDIFAVR